MDLHDLRFATGVIAVYVAQMEEPRPDYLLPQHTREQRKGRILLLRHAVLALTKDIEQLCEQGADE